MKWNVELTIRHPEEKGTFKLYVIEAELIQREGTYGNGYYLYLQDNTNTIDDCYDLRYDAGFDPGRTELVIAETLYDRWSGKNGAWKVCSLRIEEAE